MYRLKDSISLKKLEECHFNEEKQAKHFFSRRVQRYWTCDGTFLYTSFMIVDLEDDNKIKRLDVLMEPVSGVMIEQKLRRCPRRWVKNLLDAELFEKVKRGGKKSE